MKTKPTILVILGTTSTGKSNLAVQLAREFNGEVVSADSRQVYIGLDIGTGKITKKEMLGVPHHLLDVISPKKIFSVNEWKARANNAITDILSREKIPIICGGTGFYIQSIVKNITLPEVPPNTELRKKLEKKSAKELLIILKKLDPKRAETIETGNPVRLIRAVEIATALGSVPEIKEVKNPYKILQIGLKLSETKLKSNIHARFLSRMKIGMIREAETLHKNGLSWKRMHSLGLEYRYLADFLQKKISKQELEKNIEKGNLDYAKRQKTWFKRDKNIKWFNPSDIKKIQKEVSSFLYTH